MYPRLQVKEREEPGTRRTVESGMPELDRMLGGGLELGTASMVTGPDGTGKTSLCTLYAYAAAQRGQRLFDERRGTFFARAEGLGMDFKPYEEQGLVTMRTIDTGEISPGEFAHLVRHDTQEGSAEIVLIDSLSGYFNAMPEEKLLMIHMQELLSYLNRHEVLSLVVVSEQGIVGSVQQEEVDVGYMADTILLLRHFEAKGAIRQAVSVVKKRHGAHEHTIRQLFLSSKGVQVGEPIADFSGVLSGTPTFEGDFSAIIEKEERG